MRNKAKHLILYDGTCGMCHRAVQFVLKRDKEHLFVFAPLQGTTAAKMLKAYPATDSLVLIENYKSDTAQILDLGKGALRICWLLGGPWVIPGAISFLPSFTYDWIYKLIAKRRFCWFPRQTCLIPPSADQSRFLP